MKDDKKFELNNEALDSVAGEQDAYHGAYQHGIRNPNYACSNCGWHEFIIVDGDRDYYSGNCINCGTYNSRVSTVADAETINI